MLAQPARGCVCMCFAVGCSLEAAELAVCTAAECGWASLGLPRRRTLGSGWVRSPLPLDLGAVFATLLGLLLLHGECLTCRIRSLALLLQLPSRKRVHAGEGERQR